MTEREGFNLPDGTPLRYQNGEGIIYYGKLDKFNLKEGGTCWFKLSNNSGWSIYGRRGWKYYTIATPEEYTLAKLEENKMSKMSVGEILKKYSDIIREAEANDMSDLLDEPEKVPTENIPDESLEGLDDKITNIDQLSNPVNDLAQKLGVDSGKIEVWLKDNRYELTPIGGLSNDKGNV